MPAGITDAAEAIHARDRQRETALALIDAVQAHMTACPLPDDLTESLRLSLAWQNAKNAWTP